MAKLTREQEKAIFAKGETKNKAVARDVLDSISGGNPKHRSVVLANSSVITESEINLIRNRANKYQEAPKIELEYPGLELTPEQTKKGYDYLMDQWKSPTGKVRENNPFGSREEAILENFDRFTLVDFYDAGNAYHKSYVPYYRVYSKDGDYFEYAYYGGEVHILG